MGKRRLPIRWSDAARRQSARARPMLLCYDIRDPKRLVRVQALVSRWMWMVQYSVYYAELTAAQLQALEGALRPHVREGDSLRVYAVEALAQAVYQSGVLEGVMAFDARGGQVLGRERAV